MKTLIGFLLKALGWILITITTPIFLFITVCIIAAAAIELLFAVPLYFIAFELTDNKALKNKFSVPIIDLGD